MINVSALEEYFPSIGGSIEEGDYTFRIILEQDEKEKIFVINLKIKQKDTKKDHLIKFKIGLGKDKESESRTHDTKSSHFEIDLYKREKDAFSANVYFTFKDSSDKMLLKYAKGTVVLISKIIKNFLESHSLDKETINEIIFYDAVNKELSRYESDLIDALCDCYKKSLITVREKGKEYIIKTQHQLSKYLNKTDLEPLYLPLLEKIEK